MHHVLAPVQYKYNMLFILGSKIFKDLLPVLALSFSAADCCITEMKKFHKYF